MPKLPVKAKMTGTLTLIEEIEDIEQLRTMYKQVNVAHDLEMKRSQALESQLEALIGTLDTLLGFSKLAHDLKNVQQSIQFLTTELTELQAANGKRTVQITDILQRLTKLEMPEVYKIAKK